MRRIGAGGVLSGIRRVSWAGSSVSRGASATPNPRATGAAPVSHSPASVDLALAQVGTPYVWGGNGPANGDVGVDCSGLTSAACADAEIAPVRTVDGDEADRGLSGRSTG